MYIETSVQSAAKAAGQASRARYTGRRTLQPRQLQRQSRLEPAWWQTLAGASEESMWLKVLPFVISFIFKVEGVSPGQSLTKDHSIDRQVSTSKGDVRPGSLSAISGCRRRRILDVG